jgi:hypothetical protein
MLLEPTLIYLEGITNIVRGATGSAFVEGLHIMLFSQDCTAVDKTDRERNFRVLHPKTGLLRRAQNEEHSLLLRESASVHQSIGEGFRGIGYFGL